MLQTSSVDKVWYYATVKLDMVADGSISVKNRRLRQLCKRRESVSRLPNRFAWGFDLSVVRSSIDSDVSKKSSESLSEFFCLCFDIRPATRSTSNPICFGEIAVNRVVCW